MQKYLLKRLWTIELNILRLLSVCMFAIYLLLCLLPSFYCNDNSDELEDNIPFVFDMDIVTNRQTRGQNILSVHLLVKEQLFY